MEPSTGSPAASPQQSSPAPRLDSMRRVASFYDKADAAVEELSGEGVVIELMRSGKCVRGTLARGLSRRGRHRLKAGSIDGILAWLLDVRFEGDARVQRAFLLCYRL